MQNKRCIRGRFSVLKRPQAYNLVYHLRREGAVNVWRSLHADHKNSIGRADHPKAP